VSTHVTAVASWNEDLKRLVFVDQMAFNAHLRRLRLEDGEQVEIDVQRLIACRSSKANREYWGYVVRPVALYSQQTLNEIHRLFKAEFLPSERLVIADHETGEVKFEREVEQASTAKLPDPDFEHYKTVCREFGMTRCGIDFSPQGLWEQFGIGQG